MSVEEHDRIDIVAVDEAGGTVVLSLVETRSWGERGELLPSLASATSTPRALSGARTCWKSDCAAAV